MPRELVVEIALFLNPQEMMSFMGLSKNWMLTVQD
jgi:hypothetical protein